MRASGVTEQTKSRLNNIIAERLEKGVTHCPMINNVTSAAEYVITVGVTEWQQSRSRHPDKYPVVEVSYAMLPPGDMGGSPEQIVSRHRSTFHVTVSRMRTSMRNKLAASGRTLAAFKVGYKDHKLLDDPVTGEKDLYIAITWVFEFKEEHNAILAELTSSLEI